MTHRESDLDFDPILFMTITYDEMGEHWRMGIGHMVLKLHDKL